MDGRSWRWPAVLAVALLAGVGLGALGRLSDYAPLAVRAGFNLGVPWLLAAMAAGALVGRARLGAAAGGLLLTTAMTSYYAILLVVERRGGGGYAAAMALSWGGIGAIAGAAFAFAGAVIRRDRGLGRVTAVALAGGALAGEGLWLPASGAYVLVPLVVALEVAIGALLPLSLARRPAHLAAGVALTVGLAVVGMVGAAEVRELVWAQGWRGR